MTEYLEQVREAEERLREVIREARECIKDLAAEKKAWYTAKKLAIADVLEVKERVHTEIEDYYSKLIKEHVESGLKSYSEDIKTAVDKATQAVFDRFDKIVAVLMGEEDNDNDDAQLEVVSKQIRIALAENPLTRKIPHVYRKKQT